MDDGFLDAGRFINYAVIEKKTIMFPPMATYAGAEKLKEYLRSALRGAVRFHEADARIHSIGGSIIFDSRRRKYYIAPIRGSEFDRLVRELSAPKEALQMP
jgi:hypothetical protein